MIIDLGKGSYGFLFRHIATEKYSFLGKMHLFCKLLLFYALYLAVWDKMWYYFSGSRTVSF
jgi:hypothetical protein